MPGDNMKNKKAWLRIVEAFLAVVIIASVLLIVFVRQPNQTRAEEIAKFQRAILRQIALDDVLRQDVLIGGETEKENIISFINENKPDYWNFEIEICGIEDVCGISEYPPEALNKEIYAQEILITSTLENYSPKKLKMFVWE